MVEKKHLQLAMDACVLIVAVYAGITGHIQARKRAAQEAQEAWLALGPIRNEPVRSRIYDVNFAREFNDMNDIQLKVAQAVGVPPIADREAAEHMKSRLVKLEDTDTYVVDSLTHSIPYLIPSAKELLDLIGKNFQDSLAAKGLNPNKLIVTSVLRTEADVAKLRRRNLNASENSTHRYGTTFDLSYWNYVKIPENRGRPYEDVPQAFLRATLSQVLKDIHDQPGTCYIKFERRQSCFHITVRK